MGRLKRFIVAGFLAFAAVGSAQAADTVTSKILRNAGGSWGSSYAFLFTGTSDGTGETAVVKVSTAALQNTPTKLKITKIKWNVQGEGIAVLFDATTDDRVMVLAGDGEYDAEKQGGPLIDPQSSGHTGNILFTTIGASLGDSYTVYLEAKASD
jgi:hypothetical protein